MPARTLTTCLPRLSSCFSRFRGDARGVAAVELALAAPLLLAFFCGTAEMSGFLTAHFRAAQMAMTVSDVVARYEMVSGADVESIFAVSSEVMGTADFAENGHVIMSSVARGPKAATASVAWQCDGGGELDGESRVGKPGKAASLPGGLQLGKDDNVIVAEVFYQYTPIFDFVPLPTNLIYKDAVFRPRLGALTTAPGC